MTSYFRPRRLGHANLFVSDYERSAEFYNQVVGFEEVYRQPNNRAAFLSNGNTYHDLALTSTKSKYARGVEDQKPGLFHLAFELETEADLVEGYNRAKEDGVEFELILDHDVARSVYKNDYDKNTVEIYADIERDWRPLRSGIINKEKPLWIPGVTSVPLTEPAYPDDPEIVTVAPALFHAKKITHVALVAKNFEGMFRYYVDVVGLVPMIGDENSPWAVLSGALGLADLTLYRQTDGLTPGLHHVGFEVWDEADLEQSIAALAKTDITVERVSDDAARRSVTIHDPDGLRLQFFVNRNWNAETVSQVSAENAPYVL